MTDEQFERLKVRLERLLGLDLDAYRQAQMRRRITTHVTRQKVEIDDYIADLGENREQLADLRDMITIDVTEFFRDQAQWQQLRSAVLPELLKQRDRAVSIWSAGCSTGQEPYSLAMQLSEAKALTRASILCTDFDHDALAKARAGGPYTATEIEGIPEGEISQHFNESDDGFTASVALRRHLEFKELNLLKGRFGRGYDLVVCRNVMIYFNSGVKSGLVARFVESLKPGGVLFIGATEALLGHDLDGLERLGGNFYRKRAEAAVMDRAA